MNGGVDKPPMSKCDDLVRRLRATANAEEREGRQTLAAEIREAIAALEAAERNERRYLWLRAKARRSMMHSKKHAGDIQVIQWADRTEANVLSLDALDTAVDAAIRETGCLCLVPVYPNRCPIHGDAALAQRATEKK